MVEYFPSQKRSLLGALASVLFVALLAGCGSSQPVRSSELVASNIQLNHQHPYSAWLRVKGSGTTIVIGTVSDSAEILSAAQMKESILSSNDRAHLFTQFKEDKNSADFLLDVTLFQIGMERKALFDWGAVVKINWRLKNRRTGKTVYQKLIQKTGVGTKEDSWNEHKAYATGAERATRANIAEAFDQMSRLKL